MLLLLEFFNFLTPEQHKCGLYIIFYSVSDNFTHQGKSSSNSGVKGLRDNNKYYLCTDVNITDKNVDINTMIILCWFLLPAIQP